jgi:hypothetical protein
LPAVAVSADVGFDNSCNHLCIHPFNLISCVREAIAG